VSESTLSAAGSGTFQIAGRTVNRLGFGAMRITGPGIWGEPADRDQALAVLRRTVELGINFIDTADSYGPGRSEELIAEALHPYPAELLIATKAGLVRTGPDEWHPVGRPAYLRQQAELSLRRLKVDRLDLLQLHRIDPEVPLADQIGELKALQDEGKVAAIGVSEVSVDQLKAAGEIAEIATVQNLYNLTNRRAADVLDYATERGIGFIPWYPVAGGELVGSGTVLDDIVRTSGATASQVALAWLLAKSPVMLPIPGTSQVSHLEENVGAAGLRLTEQQLAELEALA
jgi:aryl-alcohol dehydrogenase-like predicted oxidoreductase